MTPVDERWTSRRGVLPLKVKRHARPDEKGIATTNRLPGTSRDPPPYFPVALMKKGSPPHHKAPPRAGLAIWGEQTRSRPRVLFPPAALLALSGLTDPTAELTGKVVGDQRRRHPHPARTGRGQLQAGPHSSG
ncbi:hypothetical protein RZS08_19655, partial [Arthrospira platensis SPKY1]|nr:hypothetical protein [Arthrospira platensis SPKY1]